MQNSFRFRMSFHASQLKLERDDDGDVDNSDEGDAKNDDDDDRHGSCLIADERCQLETVVTMMIIMMIMMMIKTMKMMMMMTDMKVV